MALLSDASRWPDWYLGMTEIDIAAPFPEQGGKVVFKVKSVGMSMSITETVLDYQPDKLQLLQMEGMLSGRARWELNPEGDGTRLTTTFDYALPGGVLGRLADASHRQAHECQDSRRRSQQLQGARRAPIGCSVAGRGGFKEVAGAYPVGSGWGAWHAGFVVQCDGGKAGVTSKTRTWRGGDGGLGLMGRLNLECSRAAAEFSRLCPPRRPLPLAADPAPGLGSRLRLSALGLGKRHTRRGGAREGDDDPHQRRQRHSRLRARTESGVIRAPARAAGALAGPPPSHAPIANLSKPDTH